MKAYLISALMMMAAQADDTLTTQLTGAATLKADDLG